MVSMNDRNVLATHIHEGLCDGEADGPHAEARENLRDALRNGTETDIIVAWNATLMLGWPAMTGTLGRKVLAELGVHYVEPQQF